MIIRRDTPFGRFYETEAGVFPSVTTVLGSIPNPHIQAWRDSMGHEAADLYTRRAAARGTRLHAYCEAFLLKEELPKLDVFDRHFFKGIDSVLEEIKPIAVEKFAYSRDLKVAGAIDCICKFRGKLCILDFKTASKQKFDGEFDSYWMQTAAYANMIEDQFDLKIEDLCIVMQSEQTTDIFFQKREEWEMKFREIRRSYVFDQEALDKFLEENH